MNLELVRDGRVPCTCLKIQNTVANVFQKWRASHVGESSQVPNPNDDQIKNAVISFQEREKRVPKTGKNIEVQWKEEDTYYWFRGKLRSVKPAGVRVVYNDGDVRVHDFQNDSSQT